MDGSGGGPADLDDWLQEVGDPVGGEGSRELGFRNASQVVAAETGAPAREIHATARTGRWLDQFPLFAQAAAEGVLTLRHLRELKALDKPQRHDALIASQHELVPAARDHDFVEFTNRSPSG